MKLQPIIDKNLFEEVLIEPAKQLAEFPEKSTLHIVSGYAGKSMAERHMDALRNQGLRVSIYLVAGVKNQDENEKLLRLANDTPHFHFRKSTRNIHAKVYVWLAGSLPLDAFCGSTNYSLAAFDLKGARETPEGSQIEAMVRTDPIPANLFFDVYWKKWTRDSLNRRI